ncbi:MAG: DNA-3-methyladenine glycosylase I [Arachnia propionica]|nr:MAG: DNA-3-methyladenine glycosylase I [Arachnia propionica]
MKTRCFGTGEPLYERYHDEEWGHPLPDSPDERELFERLSLEGFQAGLSWLTVLRKRDTLRAAFADFVPQRVAAFTEDDVARLMGDPGIIRNRAKIKATINNAATLIELHESGQRLSDIVAAYAPPRSSSPPASLAEVPTATEQSQALSRHLKKLGFKFVGPTTLHALQQAIGLADGHVAGCWLAAAGSED